MRISLNSIIVTDQEAALLFYTEKLGFQKKTDIPVGNYRWLTVVSAQEPDGTELVLEPNAHPASAAYQKALFEACIPLTAFAVDDLGQEFERLLSSGVEFTTEPTDVGTASIAVFDDTCGNLIQIYQPA